MDEMKRLLIEAQVNRAVVDYWDEVDSRWGANCHERFVDGGKFSKMVGKEEIKAFYDWRRSRGERANFHLVLNMKVDVDSETSATARYVMMLYAKDGPKVHDMQLPNTISTAVEIFERVGDDWKIRSKMLDVVFRGPEPTTIMPDDILKKMRA